MLAARAPRSACRAPSGRRSRQTTVGAALAARLGVGFTDTDAIVEAVAGKPVSEIFITDGEPEFRRLERTAVAAALAADEGSTSAGSAGVGSARLGVVGPAVAR